MARYKYFRGTICWTLVRELAFEQYENVEVGE